MKPARVACGLLGAVVLGASVGCGSAAPSAYQQALDRAAQAERKDQFDLARKEFEHAAAEAPANSQQHDEALYRLAAVSTRSGDAPRAAREFLALARSHPGGTRAPRALLDAGRALERSGDPAAARAAYRELLALYPSSGNAPAAADRIVALSDGPASNAWQALIAENHEPGLDAALRYRLAQSLEGSDERAALLAYEEVARRDPLPQGTHSDEALLHAAEIRRRLGDAQGALSTLEVLLEARSSSYLAGSYERSAFARARLLEGFILRDDLGRFEDAARSFERVVSDHPKSRLVDDALFQQAAAWALDRKIERACETLERLESSRPDSALGACQALYCPDQAKPLGRRCCSELPENLRTSSCK